MGFLRRLKVWLSPVVAPMRAWAQPLPVIPVEAGDAYRTHANALGRQMLSVLLLSGFVMNLVLWPTDAWVLDGRPDLLAGYRLWRPALVVLMPALFVLCTRAPALRDRPWASLWLCVTCITALLFVATPQTIEDRTYDLVYVAPLATVGIPSPLRVRVMNLGCMLALWFAVVFGVEQAWRVPVAGGLHATMMTVSGIAAVAFGHVYTHLIRAGFRQQHELSRFADELEAQVATQTSELRALSARGTRLREDERRRVARDLHDDLGQLVHALRVEVDLSRYEAGGGQERVSGLVDRMARSMRRVLAALRPQVLDELGLSEALRELARFAEETGGVRVRLDVRDADVPDPEVRLAAFRVAQEAITNAVRHAGAAELTISLGPGQGGIALVIADDGCGFDTAAAPRAGLGLVGMRERARAVGAQLRIHSDTEGTRVALSLPPASPNALHTPDGSLS